jgi:molybdenum cofactor cytidylyltransferase
MTIGAVIVAPQGESSKRHEEQLGLFGPSQILEVALKPYLLFPFSQVVLVLGHDYHRVLNSLKGLPPRVKAVIHRKPERGWFSALSVGLAALDVELEGVVIAKGDQVIEPRVLERLLKKFEELSKKQILVPLYHGKRGFPWVISSEYRKPLTRLESDLEIDDFLKSNRKEVATVSVDALAEVES